MADFMNDDAPKPRQEVVIEDLRHRRDAGEGETEPEASVQPEQPIAAEPAAQQGVGPEDASPGEDSEVVSAAEGGAIPIYEQGERVDAAEEARIVGTAGDMADSLPPGITEEDVRAAEREQLRQLIGLGIVNYLRYQLSMIYNFAVINLGGVADPSSGLVAKDLRQAKIAIDVLEFIIGRIEGDMQPEERAELRQLVQQVKYAFLQAAAEELPPAGPAEA